MSNDTREAFEAWLTSNGRPAHRHTTATWAGSEARMPMYLDKWTQGQWLGWQAATAQQAAEVQRAVAAERERCAKLCEQVAYTHANTAMLGPEQNALRCAALIRAARQDGAGEQPK